MNKTSYILLILFVSLFSFHHSEAQERKNYELLWEVLHKDSNKKSYLFGTMHIRDERAFKFSDALLPAIKNSEMFALEIHPDSVTNSMGDNFFASGLENSFKKILTPKDYKRLSDRFYEINGIQIDSFPLQHPMMIEAMLSEDVVKATDKRTFLDAYLYGIAYNLNKQITGLEKVEDQLPPIESIDEDEIRESILEILNTKTEDKNRFLEELTQLYYEGDIENIYSYASGLNTMDRVLKNRNVIMANSMEAIMEEKSVFAAIGTAHLPGKFGVLELLRKKGYSVRKVKATFNNEDEDFKIISNIKKWQLDENKNLGYKLLTPTKAIQVEFMPEIVTKTSTDLVYGGTFTYMAIDLRTKGLNKDFDYIENIIKNQTDDEDEELISRNSLTRHGIPFTEILVKKDMSITRMQIALSNNILYSFFVENSIGEINSEYADAFFNSIELFKPEIEPTVWTKRIDTKGAYSVDIPGVISDLSRLVKNEEVAEGSLYDLKLYSAQDKVDEMLYLLRYNDQPLGYYIERVDDYLAYFEDYFGQKGTLLGEPKPIEIDGNQGFEYEVKLSDTYNAISWVFLRGNRTYLLLAQNLNESKKVANDNKFINSFSLRPFEKPAMDTIINIDNNYEFKFLKNSTITQDDAVSYDSEFKSSSNYSTTSPNSGAVYIFQQLQFKDYVSYASEAEFYEQYTPSLVLTNDSIVSNNPVKISGKTGREIVMHNKLTHVRQRMYLFTDYDVVTLMLTYIGEEELKNGNTDEFFNSFKILNDKRDFKLTTRKTKAIFKDLKSSDKDIFEKAKSAFDYYIFDATDFKTLKKNLSSQYMDEGEHFSVKHKLIDELFTLDTPGTAELLKKYYLSKNTSNSLKISILEGLLRLSEKNTADIYFDLLENHKPQRIVDEAFDVMYYLSDTIPLILEKTETLRRLTDIDQYRDKILDLIITNYDSDSIFSAKTTRINDKLISHIYSDSERYLDTLNRSNMPYLNFSLINNYISFIENLKLTTSETNKTLKLLSEKIERKNWLKTRALFAGIKLDVEMDETIISEAFEDLYTRFEIMELYLDEGIAEKIPKRYSTAEEFSRLSLYNTFGNETEEYPDNINYLGEITVNNTLYLVYNVDYSDPTTTETTTDYATYIGVVEALIPNFEDFQLNPTFYDLNEKTENWEMVAEKILQDNQSVAK